MTVSRHICTWALTWALGPGPSPGPFPGPWWGPAGIGPCAPGPSLGFCGALRGLGPAGPERNYIYIHMCRYTFIHIYIIYEFPQ